jgi:hypothetical protein
MGLIKTAAKVAVASSVHGRVQRRQQRRWADQDLRAAPVAPSPASAATAGAADAMAQQLALIAQLNELHQAGALTDAEFAAKKAQILGL